VVSDSTYVVNCFRDRWWEGWLRRGWVNSARKPVANRDLWEPLVEAVRQRDDVTFRWVKGHSGDRMNDLVDMLAVEAAKTQRGRVGTAA
jgi:ribonuclease HI